MYVTWKIHVPNRQIIIRVSVRSCRVLIVRVEIPFTNLSHAPLTYVSSVVQVIFAQDTCFSDRVRDPRQAHSR